MITVAFDIPARSAPQPFVSPLQDRNVKRLGRTVNEARRTALTPTVRRPMLKMPQWWEIIKLPKPTMVDKEEKATGRPVLCGRGEGI
jgi:hypothetical protein